MLWLPIVRFAWYLLTWEYFEQVLTLCIPCVMTWVDIVRDWILLWLIVENAHQHDLQQKVKTTKWKGRNRNSLVVRIFETIGRNIEAAANILDRAVTWLIGDEPTFKEKLTWTRPRFSVQQRVRKGRSRGATGLQQTKHWNVGMVQDGCSCLPRGNHKQDRGNKVRF